MTVRVLPYGDQALLVEVHDPSAVLGLAAFARSIVGVQAVVPAARTVLVRADDAAQLERITADLLEFDDAQTSVAPGGREHLIAVRYDGADLEQVATQTGFSVGEVVARHCVGEYRVAFCGFAPGFAYLSGLASALQLPRLASPRTSVPAGSVAIAAEYSAIYPRASPGGWLLLGHTEAAVWDATASSPALLAPGDRVRFERV